MARDLQKVMKAFIDDLREGLETKHAGETFLIRKNHSSRGGTRLIIYRPLLPKKAPARLQILRFKRIDKAIKRAMQFAFHKTGLDFYKKIRKGERTMPAKKKAVKKGGGVRRRKINEKGPMTPVCCHKKCSHPLKNKKEIKTGLCSPHQELEAENKKDKIKASRATKKQTAKKKASPPKKKAKASSGARARIAILGHPATAFIRTLGKMGLDFKQAQKAVKKVHKGKFPKDGTFRINLGKGKRGIESTVKLTKEQIKTLKAYKK